MTLIFDQETDQQIWKKILLISLMDIKNFLLTPRNGHSITSEVIAFLLVYLYEHFIAFQHIYSCPFFSILL